MQNASFFTFCPFSDVLECVSNPCKNGGTCHEHINYYRCECPLGTTGPDCDGTLLNFMLYVS